MGSSKKIFVLDTNVLLHDYKCIFRFQENDLVIPIVVLEELDKLKEGMILLITTHGSLPVNWIISRVIIFSTGG
jgi:hypothetical protein